MKAGYAMERIGEVVGVNGNQLQVVFCRPADCEKCGACQGSRSQIELTLTGNAKTGDQVVVDMPANNVLKASAIAYAIPLLGLLCGMVLGNALPVLPDHNLSALICGTAGLIIALLIVHSADRAVSKNPKWHPRLIRVISARQEEP